MKRLNALIRARSALLVLCVCAGTRGGAEAAEAVGVDLHVAIRNATARVLVEAQDAPEDALPAYAEKLTRIGVEGLDASIEFLVAGSTPAAEDRPSVRIGVRERELLLHAAAGLDRTRATARLRAAAARPDEPRRRAAVLAALGAVGGADAANRMIDLVALCATERAAPTTRELATAFEDALPHALDAPALRRLAERWDELPTDLRATTLRIAALVGTSEAAALVLHVMEYDRERAQLALAEVPRVAAAATSEVCDRIGYIATMRLADPLFPGRCEAMRALGHLRVECSVPALLERLGTESAKERNAAHWALCAMTGLAFDAAPEAWRFWYAEETAWLRDEGNNAKAGLADRDPAVATAWLRKIATLRLGRRNWAERCVVALEHPSPIVRGAACATLRELGSRSVAERLVHLLEDPDTGVRDAALAALRGLTGHDLPAESVVWRRKFAEAAVAAAGHAR